MFLENLILISKVESILLLIKTNNDISISEDYTPTWLIKIIELIHDGNSKI